MKYALISDIHANLEALQAVLEKANELEVDQFLCLGDVVGYNAEPVECVKIIRSLNTGAIIKGNHDENAAQDSELTGFNPQAAKAIQWTRDQLSEEDREWLASLPYRQTIGAKVTLVHATLDMPHLWGYIFDRFTAAASLSYQFSQLCFVGHTHVPQIYDKYTDIVQNGVDQVVNLEPGHKYLINIGSVGQPRDGDPRSSFAVHDTEERTIEIHRVEYDIQKCQDKILAAGLPERLAARLAVGR